MKGKPRGLLFVVSGPSGTGKTTLCRAMLAIFPDLYFSVSYTTRPQRPGDINGKDYVFVSAAEFQRMLDREDFLEWAEIYGHRYGTSKTALKRVQEEGRDVLLDIDGQGARQLREKCRGGIFIFLLPPSVKELERRLSQRKTEGKAAMAERLRQARAEMAEARGYDYLLINDHLDKAREQLKAIILTEHCRGERMMESLEALIGEN